MPWVNVQDVGKIYPGAVPFEALTSINLQMEQGEFVGIMGPSGSGKTTLLNIISTIDAPTSGEVLIKGQNPHRLKPEQLAIFRRRELGFVFQTFNLLNTLTVKENIVLPLTLDGTEVNEMLARVDSIAEKLGIGDILERRTYEISGGQAQRVAIARALIHRPALLLADEPTGNLDSKNARTVMEFLAKMNQQEQATVLLVTHDPQAASYCDRVIFIRDGKLYAEIHNGGKRAAFYQKILNLLSLMGGEGHEFSTIGDEQRYR